MIVWPCLLFLPLVCFSAKITPEENAELKKICGATNLDDGILSKLYSDFQNLLRHVLFSTGDHPVRGKLRIQGGIPIWKNQYPWIAALHRGGGWISEHYEYCKQACTGSLISNRHILTAAHCVIVDKGVHSAEECRRKNYTNMRIKQEGNWTIFVGSGCTNPEKCDKGWLKPDQIYYHEDFNECSIENDIAIFEFKNDIPRSMASPICMPHKNHSISHTLKVVGSGRTGYRAPVEGYKTIDVHFIGAEGKFIEVEVSPQKGICEGDSGGPFFQTDGRERNVQIGIESKGHSCMSSSEPNKPHKEDAVDVREYLDWICEKTGVCPMEEHNKNATRLKST